jgi:hypothetical protein
MARKRATRRRWVREVKTDSTAPPPGTLNRPAAEIAATMARKDVSPKATGSGVRMIQYFINRAGKTLSPTRRRELERAKPLLQRRAAGRKTGRRKTTRKGNAKTPLG